RDAATTVCRGSFLRVGVLGIRSTVRSISPLSEELQQHRPVASHGFHSHRILRFNARYGGWDGSLRPLAPASGSPRSKLVKRQGPPSPAVLSGGPCPTTRRRRGSRGSAKRSALTCKGQNGSRTQHTPLPVWLSTKHRQCRPEPGFLLHDLR